MFNVIMWIWPGQQLSQCINSISYLPIFLLLAMHFNSSSKSFNLNISHSYYLKYSKIEPKDVQLSWTMIVPMDMDMNDTF